MDFKYKVFLSYPAGYSTAAEYIAEKLHDHLITVWLNEWHYTPESPWEETITEALQKSENTLILIDKEKLAEDKWYKREIEIALDVKKGVRIFVALLPGTGIQDIPDDLKGSTIFDLNESDQQESTIKKIAYSIEPELFINEAMPGINRNFAKQDYTSAIDDLERLAGLLEMSGTSELSIAKVTDSLATSYLKSNKPEKALEYYLRIKAFVQESDQEEDKAKLFNNLGICYFYLGKFHKAVEFCLKGLNICKENNLETIEAIIHNNLAAIYEKLQDNESASVHYLDALKHAFRDENRELEAPIISNIAELYMDQSDYTTAYRFYERAVHQQVRTQKPDHQAVYAIFGNMAFIKYNLRQYREAIDLFNTAIDVLALTRDGSIPLLGNLFSVIGTTYSKIGDRVKAKEKYFEALDIYIKEFGRNHVKVATTFNNIAHQLFMVKNYKQSVEYYREALSVFITCLGESHQNTIMVAENLKKAEDYFEEEKDVGLKEKDSGSQKVEKEG